jgi:hypothetical protein
MEVRVIASLVFALCHIFTGTAFASSIGVFWAADGSDCDFTQAFPAPVTFYLVAVLGGDAAAAGITGAEFRVDNVPTGMPGDGWFIAANSEAPLTSVGNPILGGGNIAFPMCQMGATRLLYTVTGFASTILPARTMTVNRHTTPSNSELPLPVARPLRCTGVYRSACLVARRSSTVASAPLASRKRAGRRSRVCTATKTRDHEFVREAPAPRRASLYCAAHLQPRWWVQRLEVRRRRLRAAMHAACGRACRRHSRNR